MAKACGCHGVVCAGSDLKFLKKIFKGEIITKTIPAIRKTGSERASIDSEVGPFGFNVSSSAPEEQEDTKTRTLSKKTGNLKYFCIMVSTLFRPYDFYHHGDVALCDEIHVLLSQLRLLPLSRFPRSQQKEYFVSDLLR